MFSLMSSLLVSLSEFTEIDVFEIKVACISIICSKVKYYGI